MKINFIKIFIVLITVLCVNVKAQYLGVYMNGITVPGLRLKQVDEMIKSDVENLKKHKIKSVKLYDEKNKLTQEAFYDKQGRIFEINDYDFTYDSISKKTTYEYNADGFLSAWKFMIFDGEKKYTAPLPHNNAVFYEYKDGREFRIKEDTLKKNYGLYEAMYTDNILTGIKAYDIDRPEKFILYKMVHAPNTTTFMDTTGGGEFIIFRLSEVKDTIRISSGMLNNEEFIYFSNGKIISEGTLDNYYTNYFYKENGLIDYTIGKETDFEKKLYYRYEYYEE